MFYLGTHMPAWLARPDAPPLFVSHRRLAKRVTLPRATGRWALDSGGFTELSDRGRWETTPRDYVRAVRRYADEIGQLDWAAPQDWMCEPQITAKTGLSVVEHQRRTVGNYLDLRALAPDLPFIPVLQGWTADDYDRCAEMYAAAGVNLSSSPRVGVGTVCRRQSTSAIEALFAHLATLEFRLHGFGVKTLGLAAYSYLLTSADSMSWSLRGRNVPGCTLGHKSEANCYAFALRWRTRVLTSSTADQQMSLAL